MQVAFRLLLDCRRRTDLAERRDRMDMDRMGRDVAAKGTIDPVRVPRVPGGTVERDRRYRGGNRRENRRRADGSAIFPPQVAAPPVPLPAAGFDVPREL